MVLSIVPITSRDIYDGFVNLWSPNALFQTWGWGEVLQRQGKQVWRYGIYDNANPLGVFQITKVVARRGSFLHVRHGPVLANQSIALWREVVTFLKHFASREHVWFIRINPLLDSTKENDKFLGSLGFIPSAIHAMDAEHCWVLDLNDSEEQLLANMRKTTRYEIRKAQKNGIKIITSKNVSDLKHFERLYEATAKRHGFVKHSEVREEFEIFAKEGNAALFLADDHGEYIASAIILFQSRQAIYHHGASIDTNTGASYLIQWEAIREAKKRGLPLYNFWGIAPSDKPDHPWTGHTLFKKGFGGGEVNYIHAHDLPISPLYFIPRTIETVRRIRKGY